MRVIIQIFFLSNFVILKRIKIFLFFFLMVYSVPRAVAETFDRSPSCGRTATAAEPQPQVFYEKFNFQNI